MNEDNFKWLKEHADTAVVLGALLSSVLWMSGKFTDIQIDFHKELASTKIELKEDIGRLDKEIGIIKTVLIMQHIMPQDLVQKEEQ